MNILICRVQDELYAFDLACIERIVLAVEITPLPRAPEFVSGAINVHGSCIPLLSMRRLLGLQTRQLELQDHFILCYAHQKRIALWVDQVKQVRTLSESDAESMKDIDAVKYVLKEEGQITLLYDLEKLIPDREIIVT